MWFTCLWNPDSQKVIDPATKEPPIDYCERSSEVGIARAPQGFEQWLQDYVNRKYARKFPNRTGVIKKKKKESVSV